MALVAANDTWQSATLTVDESWQVRYGQVLMFHQDGVTPSPDTDTDFGALLHPLESHFFPSGATVWYRRAPAQTGRCEFSRNELSTA